MLGKKSLGREKGAEVNRRLKENEQQPFCMLMRTAKDEVASFTGIFDQQVYHPETSF
jgi:hypothetical protein